MADLIDRDKVIAETWREPRYTDPLNVLTEIRERIRNIPSAQPEQKNERWIPCTEGLPGVYIDVIVSSKRGVQVMHMTPGGYWTDGAQLDAPGYVEAWMPMPERWKGAE